MEVKEDNMRVGCMMICNLAKLGFLLEANEWIIKGSPKDRYHLQFVASSTSLRVLRLTILRYKVELGQQYSRSPSHSSIFGVGHMANRLRHAYLEPTV